MAQNDSELREQLLAVDTVYKIGKNETTQFLIPNYYADRLVEFITAYKDKAVEEVLDRLEAEKKMYVTSLAWKKSSGEYAVPISAIQAERHRLKGEKPNDQQ